MQDTEMQMKTGRLVALPFKNISVFFIVRSFADRHFPSSLLDRLVIRACCLFVIVFCCYFFKKVIFLLFIVVIRYVYFFYYSLLLLWSSH